MNDKSKVMLISASLSCAVLTVAFVMVASAAAQTGDAQVAGVNQIVIRAQETGSGQIIVDSVIAAQAGWLAIYTDTSISTLHLVGWVPIHAGTNAGLKVDVNNDAVEPYAELWAVLHVDRGEIGLMELPKIDGPAQNNGQIVMAAFGTQAQPGVPAPVAVPVSEATLTPTPAAMPTPALVVSAGQPSILPPAGSSGVLLAQRLALIGLGGGLALIGLVLARRRQAARCGSEG